MKVRIINPEDVMSADATVVPFQKNELVLVSGRPGARESRTNYGAWLARKANQTAALAFKKQRYPNRRKHSRRPRQFGNRE